MSAVAILALTSAGLGSGITATASPDAPAGKVIPSLSTSAVNGARTSTADSETVQTEVELHSTGQTNLLALAREGATTKAAPGTAPATDDPNSEIPPRKANSGFKTSPVAKQAPNSENRQLVSDPHESLHFEGINAADSRYADNGDQFTSEPPDQALCVGNGFTMEGVNTAVAVFDRTGAQLAPTVSINEFFGFASVIDREDTVTPFGKRFAFDPVCLYDHQVDRWFFVVTELDQNQKTGDLTGQTNLFIAVSETDDPLGDYEIYRIDTESGDRTDKGCPCFDDFPHIGADRNGFYITANRFPLFKDGFNGAQVYAIDKRELAANASEDGPKPTVVSINAGRIDGDPSFTVQPAAVPEGGSYTGDREYFLSTTDFDTLRESKIGVWALSNTDSLSRENPDVRLTQRTIPSLTYVAEPRADQKRRATPPPLAEEAGERPNKLDSASDMSEVEYAAGRLWGAIGTAVGDGDNKRDAVLYVQVKPSFTNGRADGKVVEQGYVSVAVNHLMYPAIGVNSDGDAAMVMSVSGRTVFPSPSYIKMDKTGVRGPVKVMDFGERPNDGFTCYKAFVGSRARGCRWGDYSAATADNNGRIWMATEFISSGPRVPFANWSTQVIRYLPDANR